MTLPVSTLTVIALVLRNRNNLYAQTSFARFFKSKENKYRVLISTLNFTHHNVIDEIIKTLTQREITRSLKNWKYYIISNNKSLGKYNFRISMLKIIEKYLWR